MARVAKLGGDVDEFGSLGAAPGSGPSAWRSKASREPSSGLAEEASADASSPPRVTRARFDGRTRPRIDALSRIAIAAAAVGSIVRHALRGGSVPPMANEAVAR